MNLRALFAKYAVGGAHSKDYIAWAEQMLVAGEDSPALRILAGMDLEKHVDSVDVRDWFAKAVSELGIDWPDEKEALRQYAGLLVDDILGGRVHPRKTLSELASLYVLSDYENSCLSIWYELEDAVAYVEAEGDDLLYAGMTTENIDEIILREAELYKIFAKIDLPEDFHRMMYCGKCDFFGVPKYIRQEINWLPGFVFRLVLRRNPMQKAVCGRCGGGDLFHSGAYEARKKYVEMVR